MSKPLTGITVLVTRPAHQAGGLAERIRTAGGKPVLFPVLEILDVINPRPLLEVIRRLDEFDLAVFISPNAVNKAMSLIHASRSLPPGLKVAAVGQGTSKALRNFDVQAVIAPTAHFDSEALLDMAELKHLAGKHVVIFRGDGGRELLGKTLLERGAILEYAECYRRAKPSADVAPLLKAGARGEISAITITSSEGLRNLFDMVGEAAQAWLKQTPLFVSHERIAESARTLGCAHVILTPAGDYGLLEGLSIYFRSKAGGDSASMKP
ncbi:uroporphyrinogen-III synthase [Nitrosovibrio tenuis]|uniref:Uroporphyrinogen-III synthase n=1 Tax=Nitrosovibrio tenuis TaxID=1233 RepID=A0A1H7LE51_9PROT|nr:uroporphyrinogen-III synthase [Nitrosovibrio tenuis]SEK97100.1 uroporphyrinogen-III synthase [Nitrosovibrio tenuis]